MELSMPTAIAICGVSFTALGALTAILRFIKDGSGDDESENGEVNGHVRRGEWRQSCRAAENQYEHISETLDRIESKHDAHSRWIQSVVHDHEKRLGIIEARHKDFTGDDLGTGSPPAPSSRDGEAMGFRSYIRTDRRHYSKQRDTGERRRKSDFERSFEGKARYGATPNGLGSSDEEEGQG